MRIGFKQPRAQDKQGNIVEASEIGAKHFVNIVKQNYKEYPEEKIELKPENIDMFYVAPSTGDLT